MGAPRENRLIHEKSPYLLQHAHNPVDWYPWGNEAFARARAEDKPVLLSVGYSACHWCHVMERESFEDEETAVLMNESFVCIKVDREERPDVDQIYQHAVQLLSQHGGWPLTVFLTPEGKPFFGGTYFPPDERYGRPSFRRVLLALAQAWRTRRADVDAGVRELAAGLDRLNRLGGAGPLAPEITREAAALLVERIDRVHGGFVGAPKFPNATSLSFLFGHSGRDGDDAAGEAVVFTLRNMAAGGIYDHLGGGFHRYSVDGEWLVPHFEKMLYDNALLIRLYFDAWRRTSDANFLRIAEESVAYLLREMRSPEGGFYTAQDADSEGEEGKFFVWTPEEIAAVAGADAAKILCARFGVTDAGNFEDRKSVLHVEKREAEIASALGLSESSVREVLEHGRRMLFETREQRAKPARDEKILTSCNALVIVGLCGSPRAEHIHAARAAAELVLTQLWRDGRLLRSYRDGDARHEGVLDDYSFFGAALLALHQATLEPRWLERALDVADAMLTRFWSAEERVFYLTAPDVDLFHRPRSTFDQAIPSGAGVAAELLLRLGALTGRSHYIAIANTALEELAVPMRENPFGLSSTLEALDVSLHGVTEVVVIGPREDERTTHLLEAARSGFDPDRLLCHAEPGATPPAALAELLRGKDLVLGRPTAYVCRGETCSAPVSDPEDLARAVQRRSVV